MEFLGVIPARMGSTRLPAKALALIGGVPMVVRVLDRARRARRLCRVVVATDHEDIAEAVTRGGGEALLTGDCPSGTHRVAEAVALLGWDQGVINVQGDMPGLDPAHVDQVAALIEVGADFGTLAASWPPAEDPRSTSLVKVLVDDLGWAVDFTRVHHPERLPRLHVGIYGFGPGVVERFVALPLGPRAQAEDLEQWRWLESGGRIRVGLVDHALPGVDTLSQLVALRGLVGTGDGDGEVGP